MKKKKQRSLRRLKEILWGIFSEYIRKRGADEGGTNTCITCGKLAHWTELHAGHFVSGRTNSVLFDERIVHPQCPVCNVWKGGNYALYTLKMIDLYGRDKVEEFLALKHKIVKFTRTDIEQMIETYKGKIA